MIAVKAGITGDGYVSLPSFRISLWLHNPGAENLLVPKLYYELFVEPGGDFLGSGQAFKRGEGDSATTVMYLLPKCKEVGVASIFELDDKKIGLIERARAGNDALFRIDVYGDVRVLAPGKEGHRETNYKRLSIKVDATVPKEEWEKWLDSWMAGQRVLLVKKETLEKLDEALTKHNKADYDQLIQELELVEPTEETSLKAGTERRLAPGNQLQLATNETEQ